MSGAVYVVQEQPTGLWVTHCTDRRCGPHPCGDGIHELARTRRKRVAETAATRHRKLLATMPEPEAVPRPGDCPTCGQRRGAIEELQNLVAQLETQLAREAS